MYETIICPVCEDEFEDIEKYDDHYAQIHGKDVLFRKKENRNKDFIGRVRQPE